MSLGPEKQPLLGNAWEENPQKEHGEHEIVVEAGGVFENVKATTALKGILAVTRGVLWLGWHGDPFGPDMMRKEDREKVEKRGFLRTAWDKTVEAYSGLNKAEEFINQKILKNKTIEDILDGPLDEVESPN